MAGSTFGRIKALIIKEILAVLHDKKTRFALIMPPLIQLVVLSHAATLEVRNIRIAIFNEDSGYYSSELIQRVAGSPNFTKLYYVHSYDKMRKMIDMQDVLAAIHIAPDFSKKAAQGGANVDVILDGRKANSSEITSGYIGNIVNQLNTDIQAKQGIKSFAPVQGIYRAWFNPELDFLLYNVPCMLGVLSMILSLTVTSLSVAREREMGTFDQLLVSPLQPWQILVGKAIPAVIIGVAVTTINLIISLIMFGIPLHGSVLLFYFSMIVFVTAIIGVGLSISSVSHTQQQANLGTFVFMMPTMLLCGFSTPTENIIGWLQPVSKMIPTTHFLIIVKGIFLKDMPAIEVLKHTWPMALIAVVTLSIAGHMFSRRLE